MKVLKIQIWDSVGRDRSEKRMVWMFGSWMGDGIGVVAKDGKEEDEVEEGRGEEVELGGGNEAAKIQ